MSLTVESITGAEEWGIRSLISRHTFTVVGEMSDLLDVEQMSTRAGVGVNPKLNRVRNIGHLMGYCPGRLQMTICNMVERQSSDLELAVPGMDLPLEWLALPSDEDCLHIVHIIRTFLSHQSHVFMAKMGRPSEVERRDYRILKQIHNHCVENSNHWMTRISPVVEETLVDDESEKSIHQFFNSMTSTVEYDGEGDNVPKLNLLVVDDTNTLEYVYD